MASTSVLGTCHHDCPDTCGWVATVEDGIAVKLRGNAEHTYSQGELCPKVNRFIDRVYSPDRILTPLIKSSGGFEAASWDDALALVAERWHATIDTYGGEAIALWWDAGTQGLLQESSLDKRLFAKMGTSRKTGGVCGVAAGWGAVVTDGTGKGADPANVVHSDLVVLWATNTRLTNRHLWPFVEKARANGATIVVIDPLRTITAESADWFIQPRPGTDVALMLAMMHVLIRDDHLDHDYIERYTTGFDQLAAHVAECTPEWAGAICGLDPAEIERLAAAYGQAKAAMLRTLIGAEHHSGGAMFFRALGCLPLLTGSWREPGGGLARSVGSWADSMIDFGAFDAPHLAPGPRRGINMNHLGRMLNDPDLDPPIKSVMAWNGNPVVTQPNANAWRTGLARDDVFVVVSEQFMTDTAAFADVIFPATTQLEQVDVVPSWGHLYVGWNEPAIAPQGGAVPNTELWRRLARAMGYTEPELFESDRDLLASAMPDVDLAELRRRGFMRLPLPDDHLPYAEGGFGGVDGRAEFVSTAFAADGVPALPTFTPPIEGPNSDLAERFPLALLSPKQHTRFLNSSYTHLPKHGPAEGGPFCEIHADDAAARGIAEGDPVRVYNDRGSLDLPARLSERVRPGVVAVPFGWWSADHAGQGGVNVLTNDGLTDWGGGVAYSETLVEVAAAG
ncbi:MAG: molybdopterin-dependent oxidoreductase [Acidimicrobiales bacterium]|nr:molybdopterin-dependent oxidoreductase [Acidimicrobiales bacterium]